MEILFFELFFSSERFQTLRRRRKKMRSPFVVAQFVELSCVFLDKQYFIVCVSIQTKSFLSFCVCFHTNKKFPLIDCLFLEANNKRKPEENCQNIKLYENDIQMFFLGEF